MSFHREQIIIIERSSPLYPKAWLSLSDAPERLYAVGNTALLQERILTVVGARRTPVSALKLGKEIANDLTSHFVIATGTADGGDMSAIEGGLPSGKIICLLAGGFSSVTQASMATMQEVAKRGLVLSPHPYETAVRSFSFEYRNKLLALLGEGTLVLGAGEKSGALITAKYAKKCDRKLMALPYAPNTSAGVGCNALIKEGAYLIENAGDVWQAFDIQAEKTEKKVSLTKDEESVLTALRDLADAHVSDLVSKTNIPIFKLRAVLSALEVKGVAVSLGGNRYAPV